MKSASSTERIKPMDNQKQNFLSLLGKAVNENQEFQLIPPVDWPEILRLARAQNVHALIFDVASEILEFRKTQEYEACMRTAMAQTAGQIKRTEAFLELYRAFGAAGLHPIVMKGVVCRRMYGGYSDHRPSGDEDILIQKEEYEKVKRVLVSQGYLPERETVTSGQLEELQEISFHHADSGLCIEVHTNPFGRENNLRRQMNDCFQSVFDHPIKLDVEGTILWTMNHTDHFLFLILHVFRHMMASGFGIRQVLDILMYDKAYGDEIDQDYIRKVLGQIGAKKFFGDLVYIGNRYLGFRLPEMGETSCPEELLLDLLDNGIFGNETQAWRTSIHMTEAAVESSGTRSRLRLLGRTIFPGRAAMIGMHPELQEKPWLLPVRWVQRWGRFVRHNRENGGKLAKESMEISRRRIELLRKYGKGWK